jgi:phosphate transport system substrate-binding protein
MKRILQTIIVVFSLSAATAQVKNTDNSISATIRYNGTRLTYPLVEAWIKEFNKIYPNISFRLWQNGSGADSTDFRIASYTLDEARLNPNDTFQVVSNYAQLPVANSNHPSLKEWQTQGLTEEELKKIYFKAGDTQQENVNRVTIYRREAPVCATRAFASHFGVDPEKGAGIGVKGDDKTLLEETRKDVNGITYNNLGFIYNLQTRKLVEGIAVIPVDINKNNILDPEENFYSSLDQLIARLESGNVSVVTVDKVNLIYHKDKSNQALKLFISWVLTEGQKFNHQYGFLNINTDHVILSHNKETVLSK